MSKIAGQEALKFDPHLWNGGWCPFQLLCCWDSFINYKRKRQITEEGPRHVYQLFWGKFLSLILCAVLPKFEVQ